MYSSIDRCIDRSMDKCIDKNIDKSIVKTREPFDSRVKYATVTMPNGVKYFKGAPDIIMKGCNY